MAVDSTLVRIQSLAAQGNLRITVHGYDELASDGILAGDVIAGVADAIVIEDYADSPKGPCVLVLQREANGEPIHVVWGIPAGQDSPGVLITAYRPDPNRWDRTFMRRLQR